ncbi:MAG: hypothetical protein ABIO70_22615, partial [Pseudomonadota bacterium]
MHALLCWLLLPPPALAVPVSLPPGEDPTVWGAVLERAGLGLAAPEGAGVRLEVAGDGWSLWVRDTTGVERRVQVPVPTDEAAREDLAWLAASLLRPLRAPS